MYARPGVIQHLVLRVLEYQLTPENRGFAADGDAAARLKRAGQIPLSEPDYSQVAGLVAQHRFCVAAASSWALGNLAGFPDGGDHRALFPGRQLCDLLSG